MLRSRYFSFVMVVLACQWQGAAGPAFPFQASSGSRQSQSETNSSSSRKSLAAPQPADRVPAARNARRPAPVPIGQARPTRDRYREIQQALADAGHYSEVIDGIWGERSEAALQRYQKEQGLEPTGKLDALTLIRLGLGPQYESPANVSIGAAPSPG